MSWFLHALAVGMSSDCPNVVSLAYGLKVDVNQVEIMNNIILNCCGPSTGVTCDGDRVTQIIWASMGLTGTINETAVPSGLELIDLHGNSITGNVPSVLPSSLKSFTLHTNQLTGVFPRYELGSLTTLSMSNNKLSGNLQLEGYPNLQVISFSNNMMNGSISTFPSPMTYIYLGVNKISGEIPPVPYGIVDIYIGNNQISGTLISVRPTRLSALRNLLTDITINDPTSLLICSLGYNPLLGNPNLAYYPSICSFTGIFYPALTTIPSTTSSSTAPSTSSISTAPSKSNASGPTAFLSIQNDSDVPFEYTETHIETLTQVDSDTTEGLQNNVPFSTKKPRTLSKVVTSNTRATLPSSSLLPSSRILDYNGMYSEIETMYYLPSQWRLKIDVETSNVIKMIIKLIIDTLMLSTIVNRVSYRTRFERWKSEIQLKSTGWRSAQSNRSRSHNRSQALNASR
eukprot:NODE_10_length_47437_cov_0.363429.p8 type:complete len:457 gc:universal NODE_10_length_47437_cov_0.363429:43594-42224(-)